MMEMLEMNADDAAIVALEEEEGRLLAMTAQLGVQLRKVQRRLSVARAPGGGADEVNNNAMQDSLVALEQRLLDALKLDTVDANALARLNADINTALDAADGIQTHLRILFVGSSRCPRSFVPVEREKLECITGTDIVNGMDVALEGKDVENAKPATIVDVISYISGGCGGQLYDVIHFAGHGDSGGIVIDDGDLEGDVTSAPTVTPDVIGAAIKRYRESLPPKRPAPLIVLNTCNTRSTSLAIARASQTEVVHPAAASVFGWYAAKFARKLYKALARTWEGDDACTLDVRRALYSTNDRMLMDYDGDRFCCTYELTTSTSRISLRQDQRDLIAKCFDAKTGRYTNSIIVAPTGFGKTQLPPNVWARIVGREHTDENGVQYVQPPTRAESSSGPGAMVFVAHTHDLVLQQADELRVGFRSLGWSVRVVSFVGERALSATAAVADKLVHFGEVLKDRNALVVVCVVASILQDALDAGKADLTDVSLLVFDECHLCDGDHPYNTVMKRHWRPRNLDIIARAGGEGSLTFNPHILGVTATPFAGAQGEEGISRLMGNLCTPNMASHAGPTVAFEECACDAKGMRDAPMSKTLITLVKQCTQMLSMELRKLSNDVTPRTDVGEAQRLCDDIVSELDAAGSHVWLSKLEMASSRLKHAGIVLSSQPMLPVARLLRRAAKAVHLLYAVGPREAYDHIITFTEREMTKTDDATKRLYASIQKDELKNITRAAQHARSRQPSSLMAVLVERLRACAEESTTLVMCDMRCVVRYVHRVLAADHVLQRRSPLMMVGRTTPGAGDGTKGDTPRQSGSTRKDAFEKFRGGQCRILVATKVANLGMNAPSCAFVVSFGLALTANEYVHAKGRARKKDGRLLALDYENSSRLAVIRALEGAERQNIEAIAKVSAGDATQIAKRVLACQQSLHDTWLRQRADAERKKSEFAALASENDSSRYDAYCSCFARLYSGDAIVIVDKVHRCLKSEDWQTEFADTLCIGELDNVKTIDADTSIIKHAVLCRACRRPTGSILRHTRMHVDYAMVNVEAVHFRERGTEKEPIAKKEVGVGAHQFCAGILTRTAHDIVPPPLRNYMPQVHSVSKRLHVTATRSPSVNASVIRCPAAHQYRMV
eukprot:Opistho-2@61668